MVLSYDSGIIRDEKFSRTLVENVRFDIGEKETFALVGETGSGKTMIALSIMRLLPEGVTEIGGKIEFSGDDLIKRKNAREYLGRKIAYIPQSGADYLNPSLKVKSQMTDGLKKLGIKGKDNIYAATCENLRRAGFENPEEIAEKYPFELSGGMAGRVAIAMALATNAELVISDEATNGLNYEDKLRFISDIETAFPSAAHLIITHDVEVAKACGKIGVLLNGKLLEKGNASEILNNPRHPYTRSLIASCAENGMKETPILRSGISPCPFYGRCERAREICKERVTLRRDNDREWRCNL